MVQHLTVVDHPLVQHKLTLMRKKTTSTVEFRQLLREISQFLAYEITRNLPMTKRKIETPLEEMDAPTLDGKKLALISILRAGNGLLDGVLELVPSARVGFVGLYRDEETLQPVQYYYKVPHGEMNIDTALDPVLRNRILPANRLSGEANVLIFAHADAASGVRNIIKMKAGGLEVGPILMGMKNKAHIVTPSITARGLLNMAAIAGTPVTEYE